MALGGDENALESLPLKLMIVAVVASLSIVPAAQTLENMKTRVFLTRVGLQLDRIETTVHVVAMEGPGSSRIVDLDFSSDGRLAFSRLVLGDSEHGESMSAIVLELTNGAHLVRLVDDPPIWLCGSDGSGFVVLSPEFNLRLTSSIVNSTFCVLAEVE